MAQVAVELLRASTSKVDDAQVIELEDEANSPVAEDEAELQNVLNQNKDGFIGDLVGLFT